MEIEIEDVDAQNWRERTQWLPAADASQAKARPVLTLVSVIV